jgi:shikimate dehydrogenase
MKINKNTKICVSIAQKKGTFGLRFHNSGYELMGLDFIYVPLKVMPNELAATIQLVRDNFHACSVSMPHKIEVIKYLDELDESAKKTGAVNTILKLENGNLRGYNTDYYGAMSAIQNSLGSISGKSVLLVGAGGVARAIGNAVKDLEGRLVITNRTEQKAKDLADKLGAEYIPWKERNTQKAYLLVNATSVGMETEEMVVSEEALSHFEAVMDVVVSPKTKLIAIAEGSGKTTIPGTIITTYQGAKQFEIYTGEKLPEKFILRYLEDFENAV